MLIESSGALADAVAKGGEERLAQEYEVPFGKFTGWFLAEISLANMHYHAGQINYIQLLYGDKEFHFPE